MARPSTGVPPLILAGLITLGFAGVWVFLGLWAVETMPRPANLVTEQLVFQADGTPLIRSFSGTDFNSRRYRNLQGQPVALVENNLIGGAALSAGEPGNPFGWPLPWSDRIRSFTDGQVPPFFWYFIHDGRLHGSGYFIGYDSATKARVGFLGRSGFRSTAVPPDERFAVDGRTMVLPSSNCLSTQGSFTAQPPGSVLATAGDLPPWLVYVLADEQVYEVDLKGRSVRPVLEDHPRPILSIGILTSPSAPGRSGGHRLVIREAGRLVVLNPPKTLRSVPLPAELLQEPFTWHATTTGQAVAVVSKAIESQGKTRDVLYWISGTGTVAKTAEVTLQTSRPPIGGRFADSLLALAFPGPVFLDLIAAGIDPWLRLATHRADTYRAALAQSWAGLWPGVIGVQVLAVILAWVCARHQARYARPPGRRVPWVGFVLLLGLPGLVGYLVHRRWPVREPCPVCGRVIPRDRAACPVCGSEFPEPALTGTEVFA